MFLSAILFLSDIAIVFSENPLFQFSNCECGKCFKLSSEQLVHRNYNVALNNDGILFENS